MVPERLRLRDHAAHSHGKARRRDHEQDVIDVVGSIEVAEAVFADDVVERDLKEKAHELDQHRRHGENRRAL